MFATIWTKLATIVWTVVTNTYNYGLKLATTWYPFATVTPINSTETTFQSNSDQMEIGYQIEIFYRNDNIATNEASIRTTVDSILALLRADYTLTWSALSGRREIEWGYSSDEQPVRIAIIKWFYLVCITI